ncbi:alpha/beta fold hydrolase, partial [Microgenomates group bacterium]|nr:alpha/beta fold hydrolase [Microgenomates group bacterium]
MVLLPGLGGSWNTAAMISGGSSGSWKKTPFVKVYDNLKATFLTSAGYTEGDNYFEFYYDWRQPLVSLADSFENYLANTVLKYKPTNTKVNLVGHSMGGMVARTYAQKHGLNKINQIVTTGSPHQGAIKAWQGWSGAEIGDRWSWEWIGLQLYLQIHKGEYTSPVKAVRDLAPGLIDLSPIFNFAKNNSNQVISVTSMNSFNSYLAGLKTSLLTNLKNLMTTISGLEQSNDNTVEWIKLTNRSLTDQLLGKWADGKPDSYEYTPDGDLTVLKKSALIEGATPVSVNANHVELVETTAGIQRILDALGITATPSTNTNSLPRNPSLIFFLHSPAKIQVT